MTHCLNTLANLIQQYIWLAPVLALLGGLVTSFTPCSLSSVPMVIAYIGGSAKNDTKKAFRLSLTMAGGLALTFLIFGSLASVLGHYLHEIGAWWYGFLGRMLFAGEDGVKKVKVLSGGEKVRCLLSKMMISGANILILDEPTNHLDMESITALNNGLIKFPGVLLFASHDHQFVQTTANRIMEIMPNGSMIDKITTYDEYLASDEMARKRQVYLMQEEDN